MSSQIILDLQGIANGTGNITITPAEYFALKKEILATCINFGEVCLAVGFIFGAVSVYLYFKDKQEREKNDII
jgi:hypothetical protein